MACSYAGIAFVTPNLLICMKHPEGMETRGKAWVHVHSPQQYSLQLTVHPGYVFLSPQSVGQSNPIAEILAVFIPSLSRTWWMEIMQWFGTVEWMDVVHSNEGHKYLLSSHGPFPEIFSSYSDQGCKLLLDSSRDPSRWYSYSDWVINSIVYPLKWAPQGQQRCSAPYSQCLAHSKHLWIN